jgi:hypothetical protein
VFRVVDNLTRTRGGKSLAQGLIHGVVVRRGTLEGVPIWGRVTARPVNDLRWWPFAARWWTPGLPRADGQIISPVDSPALTCDEARAA